MKPILFNTDMVRALLEGRKTVTRRVVKPQPWGTCPNTGGDHELEPDNFFGGVATGFVCGRCGLGVCPPHMKYPVGEALFRPTCWPGDILYVRETWKVYEAGNPPPHCVIEYKAGGTEKFSKIIALPTAKGEWRPSIHMPKEAARLFLRVTNVRVERLRHIGRAEAVKEGANPACAVLDFKNIWNSTIKPADLPLYGWEANPWVWVIEFERISKEAALEGGKDK